MNLLFTLFVQQQQFAIFFHVLFYFIRENLVKVFIFIKICLIFSGVFMYFIKNVCFH